MADEPRDKTMSTTAATPNISTALSRRKLGLTVIAAVVVTIGAASGALEQTRGTAGSAGAGFKDKDVPANMIGG